MLRLVYRPRRRGRVAPEQKHTQEQETAAKNRVAKSGFSCRIQRRQTMSATKPKPHAASVSSTEHGSSIEELRDRNAELEPEPRLELDLEAMVARQQPSNTELATSDIVAGYSLTLKDNRIAELEADLADMRTKRKLDVATVLKWWKKAGLSKRAEFIENLIAGELSDNELDTIFRTLFVSEQGEFADFGGYLGWLDSCGFPMGRYVKLPEGVNKDEVDKILRDEYGKGLDGRFTISANT
jgi:hypothetical protein